MKFVKKYLYQRSVVDEIFRRADSDSLISAIVVITRLTAKIEPKDPSPLLNVLCQMNEEESITQLW